MYNIKLRIKALDMYKNMLSSHSIAKKIGVSQTQVGNNLAMSRKKMVAKRLLNGI